MNGRAWSSDDIATLRRMAKSGRTFIEIAKHLRRHADSVRHKCGELGVESGHNPALAAMMARINRRRKFSLAIQNPV